MTGRLAAVCAVHELVEGLSRAGSTAIDKRPLTGAVAIDADGVVADTQIDVPAHGGVDQALYAYAREEAERWAEELGLDVTPGLFGENLATRGLPVTDAVIGERWRIGSTVLAETTLPRVPCQTFKSWLGQPQWVRRFTDRGDTGTYLRVLTPGTVEAGDVIEVVERPAHGVTVREVLYADRQDPRRLRRLLDESNYLAAKTRHRVEQALAAVAGRR